MSFESLTLKSIRARLVLIKLNRPIVARIATLTDWPLILIDLYTAEGVIGPATSSRTSVIRCGTSSLRFTISARCSKAVGSLRSNFTSGPQIAATDRA
jgi:hypothetical protein